MRSYFLKRLLLIVPTLFGISLVSFVVIHLTPGDPALLKLGDSEAMGNQLLAAQIISETRELYGLDQPLYSQYARWLKRMVTLDFGESLRDHRRIIDKLKERVSVSIKLSVSSFTIRNISLRLKVLVTRRLRSAMRSNWLARRLTSS